MGYLKLNTNTAQTENMYDNSLEIEDIYILSTVKRQGIGKLLIEYSIKQAIINKKSIWLGVWEHNYDAIKFYKKIDFKVIDKHVFLLGQDKQTDLIMKKDID